MCRVSLACVPLSGLNLTSDSQENRVIKDKNPSPDRNELHAPVQGRCPTAGQYMYIDKHTALLTCAIPVLRLRAVIQLNTLTQ